MSRGVKTPDIEDGVWLTPLYGTFDVVLEGEPEEEDSEMEKRSLERSTSSI